MLTRRLDVLAANEGSGHCHGAPDNRVIETARAALQRFLRSLQLMTLTIGTTNQLRVFSVTRLAVNIKPAPLLRPCSTDRAIVNLGSPKFMDMACSGCSSVGRGYIRTRIFAS